MSAQVGKKYKNKHSNQIVTIVKRDEVPSARGMRMTGPDDYRVVWSDGEAMMVSKGTRTGGIHSGWVVRYGDHGGCEETTFLEHWEPVEKEE